MDSRVNIPYISIRPNYISLYWQPDIRVRRTTRQLSNETNLINPAHNGKISKKANRRIENAICWLLELAEYKKFYSKRHKRHFAFKVNFITLTLASRQIHGDNEIKKKLLNHFLTVMREKYGVKNYLWRAEAQKNKNIHFHIVADKFIAYWEIRDTWNQIQNKLGYVDRFFDKYGHHNPNSTDVHSIKNIRNLPRYLSKYCSKESKYRPIEGKQWGLSYSLSRIKSAITSPSYSMRKEFDWLCHKFKSHLVEYDYFAVLYISAEKWTKDFKHEMYNLYNEYLKEYKSLVPT